MAHAAIDVSDGLLQDFGHILQASHCGAELWLDALPAHPALAGLDESLRREALLSGGDAYELCFTARPLWREQIEILGRQLGVPVARVGTLVRGQGVRVLDGAGQAVPVAPRGFDHFADRPRTLHEGYPTARKTPGPARPILRPSAAWVFARPERILAFGLGSGLIYPAPGTWGTLVGWLLWAVLLRGLSDGWMVLVLLLSFGIGCWAAQRCGDALGVPDHGGINWDEIVAIWLVLWLMPHDFWSQAVSVALFRFFDIVKPPPVEPVRPALQERLRGHDRRHRRGPVCLAGGGAARPPGGVVMNERETRALAGEVGAALRAAGWLCATAESCTGGLLAGAITSCPGSSLWFERGFVTYSNAAKVEQLRVSPDTLERFGAVSEETAMEMAGGVRAGAGAPGPSGPVHHRDRRAGRRHPRQAGRHGVLRHRAPRRVPGS